MLGAMTATLTRPDPSVRPEPAAPAPGRMRRMMRGRADDPAWARPALLALLARPPCSTCGDLSASGYANSFYAAAVAGRDEELEGAVLRLAGRRQLDHRRQAARVAVGHGRCRRGSSASTAGACWCRRRWRASRRSALLYAAVRRWFGPVGRAARRCRAGAHAGRGADVPLRQPGRAAHAAAGRRRVRAGRATRARQLDGGWRSPGAAVGFGFLTKMMQAFLVLPAFGLVYLVAAPTHAAPADRARAVAGLGAWSCRPAGGCSRRAVAGVVAAVHRRLDRTTACSNWSSATTGSAASSARRRRGQRRRRWRRRERRLRRRDRHRPAVRHQQWAPRSPGCSRPRWSRSSAGLSLAPRRPAHRPHPRRAAAVGRLAARHRSGVQLHERHRSTRTTRSCSPRRSPRSSPSARTVLWRARAAMAARLGLAALAVIRRRLGLRAAGPHAVAGTRSCATLLLAATVLGCRPVLVPARRGRFAARRASWWPAWPRR